jgi:hypothetical protein
VHTSAARSLEWSKQDTGTWHARYPKLDGGQGWAPADRSAASDAAVAVTAVCNTGVLCPRTGPRSLLCFDLRPSSFVLRVPLDL